MSPTNRPIGQSGECNEIWTRLSREDSRKWNGQWSVGRLTIRLFGTDSTLVYRIEEVPDSHSHLSVIIHLWFPAIRHTGYTILTHNRFCRGVPPRRSMTDYAVDDHKSTIGLWLILQRAITGQLTGPSMNERRFNYSVEFTEPFDWPTARWSSSASFTDYRKINALES